MGLRDWFRGRRAPAPMAEWREHWKQAVEAPSAATLDVLRRDLAAVVPLVDDVEVEQEMLEGLEQLLALTADLAAGRPPRVETTHRVIGADACHFSAPASLPDDPAQASGRLLLTSTRAVFVGGTRLTALPWHALREVVRADRDLLLVRSAEDAVRFRFNTFGDALAAAALARYLRPKRG